MRWLNSLTRIYHATPRGLRWIYVVAVVLYVVSPFDGAPDMIPRIGRLDDVLIIVVAWVTFKRAREMAEFYKNAKRGQPPLAKSPHETLGIALNASETEIKTAYRKLMKTYHPDRFAHMGDRYEKAASEKTKEIVAAYRAVMANRGVA